MKNERFSGILLHPTSLPGPYGVGDLGPEAYAFVDFLAGARQTLWQILPLGPTGLGNSPYNVQSASAGSPLLISPDGLTAQGWLTPDELPPKSPPSSRVDFATAGRNKDLALRAAFERFRVGATGEPDARIAAFAESQQAWLDDYALFQALRAAHGNALWLDWEPELVRREPEALDRARAALADEVAFHRFAQLVFHEQWSALRAYANARGIRIVGDIPIYVALDSADVWAHQELFKLDERGYPTVVAGVPPDLFSATGQLWGNPCYRWEAMAERGYAWWLARFRRTLELCDIIRVDHFRGFVAGWQVPAGAETAVNGVWVPGPGRALFNRVVTVLGKLPILVEDLGIITEDVEELRDELGLPGMKVLQFAFGSGPDNPYLPHNYTQNCVVYSGTHDNDTTRGWYEALPVEERRSVDAYLGPRLPEISWAFIRLALGSVGRYAIVPAQDVLGLGGEARMNLPGTADGNWGWRMDPGSLTDGLRARLARLTEVFGRGPRDGHGAAG